MTGSERQLVRCKLIVGLGSRRLEAADASSVCAACASLSHGPAFRKQTSSSCRAVCVPLLPRSQQGRVHRQEWEQVQPQYGQAGVRGGTQQCSRRGACRGLSHIQRKRGWTVLLLADVLACINVRVNVLDLLHQRSTVGGTHAVAGGHWRLRPC